MNQVRKLLFVLLLVCFAPSLQADESTKKDEASKAAGPNAHTNSKGKTYYLFSKDVQRKNSDKVQTLLLRERPEEFEREAAGEGP